MAGLTRRQVVATAGLALGAAASPGGTLAATDGSEPVLGEDVKLYGDGLSLSPAELGRLLGGLTSSGEVEPDYYSTGGAVAAMEERFAAALGKDRAVFFPSGTLANHVAIRSLAGAGTRVLVQEQSHVYNDSGDCVQVLSHLDLVPLGEGRASFTADEVRRELRRAKAGRVRTGVGVISVECPVRRKLGALFDFEEMQRVAAVARDSGVRLHLDGARIYMASATTGIPVAKYAELFDTVYVSLWKYFNAPFGAVLAGPAELLDDVHHLRRMFGGGLPFAWPAAVVASHYLDGFLERFQEGMRRFDVLLRALENDGRCRVERVADGTNVAMLKWEGEPSPETVRQRLALQGVHLWKPSTSFCGFYLVANETLARMDPGHLAQLITVALHQS